jgi:DNA-binding NarL/FixJ family response regulator
MDEIRIAIADDQKLFRKAICEVIRDIEGLELVADVDNGLHLLEWLKNCNTLPDIVLVDLDMPEMNGVQLNEQLHIKYPSIKVIILTVLNQERLQDDRCRGQRLPGQKLRTGRAGNCDKKCVYYRFLF